MGVKMDLKTTYMGINFKNPLIVSSCGLSKSLAGIQKIEAAGAGGVVLKSMFEEQIMAETRELEKYVSTESHTEALDYLRNYTSAHSISAHLQLVEQAKKSVNIPIIASLNCVSPEGWSDYAKKLENSGADGLELNIAIVNNDPGLNSSEVENLYFDIVKKIIGKVSIPIAIKIGPQFSSLAHFTHKLANLGAKGLVLFNRFYQTDFDIENFKVTSGSPFSDPREISLPLHWIASLSSLIPCDFSASTGVHDGKGVVKMLLAGANTVQVCSTLYNHELNRINTMLDQLKDWMKSNNFENVEDFRGKMARGEFDESEKLDRLQYIKALTGIE
jgi:dihydroorotate dehydrogenase (fumarate)